MLNPIPRSTPISRTCRKKRTPGVIRAMRRKRISESSDTMRYPSFRNCMFQLNSIGIRHKTASCVICALHSLRLSRKSALRAKSS
jgi:hypothetical protein